MSPVLRLGWRLLSGGAALWGFDWLVSPLGFHLGLNPLTALAVGVLGLPGLAALVALRLLLAV